MSRKRRVFNPAYALTQSELSQEMDSQGVASEILSGKREMNLRQMRALAIRFSVLVTAFVGGASAAVAVA